MQTRSPRALLFRRRRPPIPTFGEHSAIVVAPRKRLVCRSGHQAVAWLERVCQRFRAMGVAPHIVELTLTTAARLSVVWPEFISGIATVRKCERNTAALEGAIGGGQIGFNYQFSPQWIFRLRGRHPRFRRTRKRSIRRSVSQPKFALWTVRPRAYVGNAFVPWKRFRVGAAIKTLSPDFKDRVKRKRRA